MDWYTGIAIITKVNFDNVNIMTALGGSNHWNDTHSKYAAPLSVEIMVNGETEALSFGRDNRTSTLDKSIVANTNGRWWRSWQLESLMSRSEHPLDEKWITDYQQAFDFLVKRVSYEKLEKDDIVDLIEKWAKKD